MRVSLIENLCWKFFQLVRLLDSYFTWLHQLEFEFLTTSSISCEHRVFNQVNLFKCVDAYESNENYSIVSCKHSLSERRLKKCLSRHGEIDTDDDELDATIWCWTRLNSLFYLRKICQKAANDMELWGRKKIMKQNKEECDHDLHKNTSIKSHLLSYLLDSIIRWFHLISLGDMTMRRDDKFVSFQVWQRWRWSETFQNSVLSNNFVQLKWIIVCCYCINSHVVSSQNHVCTKNIRHKLMTKAKSNSNSNFSHIPHIASVQIMSSQQICVHLIYRAQFVDIYVMWSEAYSVCFESLSKNLRWCGLQGIYHEYKIIERRQNSLKLIVGRKRKRSIFFSLFSFLNS